MEEVKWGIIGCGNVCEVKSGPALYKTPKSRLVAVMRRNGELARDFAKRHGVPRWYDNAQKVIDDPEVNMVYVATPPSSHKEYTLAAAKAGKPVYVEKPMAMNYAECQEMIAACEDAGVPLYVAYYRRGHDRFRKVKDLLESNAIGIPRLVNVRLNSKANERDKNPDTRQWRVKPEIAGGGIYSDLACHTLDILQFFLGPIQKVSGFATNQGGFYEAEDTVTGTFLFENGTPGVGAWSFVTGDGQDIIEIYGSEGRIALSTFGFEPVRLFNQDGEQEFHLEKPEHVHQPLVETIVSELTGGGLRCPSTGVTGARTNWVMDEMLKSYRALRQ
ncbi:MAG: Gfo/Idh/MocA family oxidoreductase [Planctomycetota bacterium]|nr:Gfo/Idh/MocA family oxidoreductase [Planctomycetota bacterium]